MIVMGGSVVPCVWVYCLRSPEAVSCFVFNIQSPDHLLIKQTHPVRMQFANFMKMDEKIHKDLLDKMLSELPSDMDWKEDDQFECLCKKAGLTRYVFGDLQSKAGDTSDRVEEVDKSSITSSGLQLKDAKKALTGGDGCLVTMIKAEFPELKECKDMCVVLTSGLAKLNKAIATTKALKGSLNLCKRSEAPENIFECTNMIKALTDLEDSMVQAVATDEIFDSLAQEECKTFLEGAVKLKDLCTNAVDNAKTAVTKLRGYLAA